MERLSRERIELEERSLEVLPLMSHKSFTKRLVTTEASTAATPSTLSLRPARKTHSVKRLCTDNRIREPSKQQSERELQEELYEAETWEYLWSHMQSKHLQIPPFCCASFVCYRDRYLILFGGASYDTDAYHGLYVYDLDEQSWSQPCVENECIATPRACHSSILVEEEDIMLVYGGTDLVNNICYDEVLELNLQEWRWRLRSRAPPPPNGPGKRWQHSAHYYDKKMYVLMGNGDGSHNSFTTDISASSSSVPTLQRSSECECMVWYLDLMTDCWHTVLTRPYVPKTVSEISTSNQFTKNSENDLHSTYNLMRNNNSTTRNSSMLDSNERHTSHNLFGRPAMSLQSHAAALDGSFVYIFGGLITSYETNRNAHLQSDRIDLSQYTNSEESNYNDALSLNTHRGHRRWLYSNKLYRYHLPTNTWSEIAISPTLSSTLSINSQPAPRYAATLSVMNHTLYLFGGDANGAKVNNYFGDLWMLKLPPESTHWQSVCDNYTTIENNHPSMCCASYNESNLNVVATSCKVHWVELKRDKSRAILARSRQAEIRSDNKSRPMYVTPEELSNALHTTSAYDNYGSSYIDSYSTTYRGHNSRNDNNDNIALQSCYYNNNNDLASTSYYTNHYKSHFTWTEQHSEHYEYEQESNDGNRLLCSRPQARSGHACVLARGCLFICGGEMPFCDSNISNNGSRYNASSNRILNNNNNTSVRIVAYDNTLFRYPLGLYTTLSLKDNVCRWLSRSKENQTEYALHLFRWNKYNSEDCSEQLLPINVEKLLNEYYTSR